MASTLCDLFWVYPDTSPAAYQVHAARERKGGENLARVDTIDPGIPAVILYPALLTPGVFVKGVDQFVELILLFKNDMQLDDDMLRVRIDRQLKIRKGLDPEKSYVPSYLFGAGNLADLIKFGYKGDLSTNLIRTGDQQKGRFRGQVESHVKDLYTGKGFTKLYCVSLHPKVFLSLRRKPSETANVVKGERVVFREKRRDDNQDYIINTALKNPKFDPEAKEKELAYGFKVVNDVRIGDIDRKLPVQTYHPLFWFDALEYANLGHLGDIHLGSRQQVLQKSQVKVIEHQDFDKPIGDYVNVYSARVKELLDGFGGANTVDLVILGGDLMDHFPNAYRKNLCSRNWPSAEDIWDFVGLDNDWANKYVNGVDFLSLYSLIIDFLKNSPKPIFVVTGNHDYYTYPYGISPRKFGTTRGKRANDGIAADHNLTFYEAILAFGPEYHRVYPSTSSPFTAEGGKWFHYYFTPFSDYAVELPHQFMVALAWGIDETVVENEGQGLGHLPRATKAFANDQLQLLNQVVAEKGAKKLILTTHFTFVSHEEDHPNTDTGIIKMIDSGTRTWQDKYTRFDMGTFEHMRRRLYKELLWDNPGNPAIQLVLTGHSHRRGLYSLTAFNAGSPDSPNDDTLATRHYDVRRRGGRLEDLQGLSDKKNGPLIILSDSGGPVPRRNVAGEFYGWGSDLPAGTRILFSNSGEIDFVQVQDTTLKPRFVVALDYMDIIAVEKKKCPKVIGSFASEFDNIDGHERERDKLFKFTLQFSPNTSFIQMGYNMDLAKVELYFTDNMDQAQQVLGKITLTGPTARGVTDKSAPYFKWIVPPGDRHLFEERFVGAKNSKTFAALYFIEPNGIQGLDRYDYSAPWAFEININPVYESIWSKNSKGYTISRCNEEFPDLDLRKTWVGYKKA